jgi:hypothetical protein
MDERDWRIERELMADVQVLAADICSDLKTQPLPSIWGQRREQIAEIRQRIKTLRLGTSAASRGQDESAP